MKDEIKEIIKLNCEEEIDVKYFAKDNSLVDTTMDYSQLLDYITNLQESEAYYYGYYKDYKSRIDKARGMIRFIAYNSERPLTITELNKVYNILGGDDND